MVWKTGPSGISELPVPRLSPDTISVEKVMLKIPAGDTEFNRQLWEEADEEMFSFALRKELQANGIRSGVVGVQLPPRLLDALAEAAPAGQADVSGASTVSPTVRMRCRRGDRKELVVSPEINELAVLCSQQGKACGHLLQGAQSVLALKAYPQGDRSARLSFLPEIHHGQARQKSVVSNGAIQLQMKREKMAFTNLECEANLVPGQTLIITSDAEPRALGQAFFGEEIDGRSYQKVMLLRIASTPRDDLFNAGDAPLPLVSDIDSDD